MKPKFMSLRWLQVRVSRMVADLSISHPEWRNELLEGKGVLTVDPEWVSFNTETVNYRFCFNRPNVQIQHNGLGQDIVKVWQRLWQHHIVK